MTLDKSTLRYGFTTGACAQAAAKGAALILAGQKIISSVEVCLPNEEKHSFELINQHFDNSSASCSVIKDAGDEKEDVTHGIEICASVSRQDNSCISLSAGPGVGTVTLPGLPVAVGEAAVNPVPRRMIFRDVGKVLNTDRGYNIEISVPEGQKTALKTYNPRLGIVGGISIIGTRGRVIPKSLKAFKESLIVSLKAAKAQKIPTVFLASGYIGERVLKDIYQQDEKGILTMGDHLGFMLDECCTQKIKKIVIIGHVGKIAKLAAGLFNTHCSYGDARLETLAAHAALQGANQETVKELLELKLAEAAIDILKEKSPLTLPMRRHRSS